MQFGISSNRCLDRETIIILILRETTIISVLSTSSQGETHHSWWSSHENMPVVEIWDFYPLALHVFLPMVTWRSSTVSSWVGLLPANGCRWSPGFCPRWVLEWVFCSLLASPLETPTVPCCFVLFCAGRIKGAWRFFLAQLFRLHLACCLWWLPLPMAPTQVSPGCRMNEAAGSNGIWAVLDSVRPCQQCPVPVSCFWSPLLRSLSR